MSRFLIVLAVAGCGSAQPPPAPTPAPAPVAAPESAPESIDGRYVFRRVSTGLQDLHAWRQTFELTIDHGKGTLKVATADDDKARTNVDIDRASFAGAPKVVTYEGTAVLAPSTNALTLDLAGADHTLWTCERITTHVSPAGARLAARQPEDCSADSAVEPATTSEVHVLSCRADNYPRRAKGASAERVRDGARWTFVRAPGIELLGDQCPERAGVLRQINRS